MTKKKTDRKTLVDMVKAEPEPEPQWSKGGHQVDTHGGVKVVTIKTRTLRTEKQLCEQCDVDLKEWEIERTQIGKWDQVAKTNVRVIGNPQTPEGWNRTLAATELWLVKIWLKKKQPDQRAFESILEQMKSHSLKVSKIKRGRRPKGKPHRALEICIMDPHLGGQFYRPGSDCAWNMDECEKWFMWALEDLLVKAEPYAPFDKILWVFGNDYLHCDNFLGTTTAGTPQPEGVAYHVMYERGLKLAIATGDRLKGIAPLEIVQISGNHDRLSTFTLGHCLNCQFHADKNVQVEVNPDPYKFWSYGVNLIGLDHGHSKKLERLAGLMANETRLTHWSGARYCEWHLGDQHRKGSGRPTVFAEMGVGIEFLTGLTPANEWHRIKTYNWQPRGAVAYVWNKESGPEARLHSNIDSYTGKPMGMKVAI